MVSLTSRVRKACQGASRGLTLIEVLIAIALMGIVSVGILGGLSTASRTVSLGDERTTAESLARMQMEYVKGQSYNSTGQNETMYKKIGTIPRGYSIWSVNRNGTVVASVVGIPWDSWNNRPANNDTGLQKISLVIRHTDSTNQTKTIAMFTNRNPNWAYGVNITLEGYKVNR